VTASTLLGKNAPPFFRYTIVQSLTIYQKSCPNTRATAAKRTRGAVFLHQLHIQYPLGKEHIISKMNIPWLSSVFLENFKLFGLLACMITFAALGIPIPFYTGRSGEKYSPLNHFVSELGEVGVSRAAGFFNGGLIAAGALFIPFMIGLGFSIENAWAKLGMIAGLWTAVWLMLIGIFPMDKLQQHIIAALSFFDGGLATITLFTMGIWLQPAGRENFPRSMVWIGLACILVNIAFIAFNPRPTADVKVSDYLRPDPLKPRPRIWLMPILEWLVVLLNTLWYLSTALILVLGK
jgi:hypothetical membrane protein